MSWEMKRSQKLIGCTFYQNASVFHITLNEAVTLQSHWGKHRLEVAVWPQLLQPCAMNLLLKWFLQKVQTKPATTHSQSLSSKPLWCAKNKDIDEPATRWSQSSISLSLNMVELEIKCNVFVIIKQSAKINQWKLQICCYLQTQNITAYIKSPARTSKIWNTNSEMVT